MPKGEERFGVCKIEAIMVDNPKEGLGYRLKCSARKYGKRACKYNKRGKNERVEPDCHTGKLVPLSFLFNTKTLPPCSALRDYDKNEFWRMIEEESYGNNNVYEATVRLGP
jgi:hypothetical protein